MTMDNAWGHCMHCKHFGSPAQIPLANEEASCEHAGLLPYQLRVFGTSGCNGFELRPGVSPRTERADGDAVVPLR
jgi:hypothetical protein